MKVNYKWPIIQNQNNQINQQILVNNQINQQILVNKKSGQEVLVSNQSIEIGTATIVFYFLNFFYIYGSALFNEFISKKKVSSFFTEFKKNPGGFFKLNTLSTSFEESNKVGTTIVIIIFMALLQGLFSSQNIYSTDPKCSSIIAFNYLIVLCWLLLMFIFPYKSVGNIKQTSWSHAFVAFCILLSLIINCFLIVNLYSEYFDDMSIKPLIQIGYAIVGASIFSILSMVANAASDITSLDFLFSKTHLLVALSELLCIILYGVFLILFIKFPPIPNASLSCILVPNSSPSP